MKYLQNTFNRLKIMTSRRDLQEKEKIPERSKRDPDIIRRDRMCAARERN